MATVTITKNQFPQIYREAQEAGRRAMAECRPIPMTVTEYENPLYGLAPGQQPGNIKNQWHVADGLCGFAWVTIHPGTSAFARWIVKNGFGRKDYYPGIKIRIDEGRQSIQLKEAYAQAFAKVLKSYGITAYAGSRLD